MISENFSCKYIRLSIQWTPLGDRFLSVNQKCFFGESNNPSNIYLFKFNNRNTRKRYEICCKLTNKIICPLIRGVCFLECQLIKKSTVFQKRKLSKKPQLGGCCNLNNFYVCEETLLVFVGIRDEGGRIKRKPLLIASLDVKWCR